MYVSDVDIKFSALLRLGRDLNRWLKPMDEPTINLRGSGKGARHNILGAIKTAFDGLVARYPDQDDWTDFPAWELYQSIYEEDDKYFAKIPHAFYDAACEELTFMELGILMAFCRYMSFKKGEEGKTFVSLRTIANKLKISYKHIYEPMRIIYDKGFKVTEKRGRTKRYRRVCLEKGQIVNRKNSKPEKQGKMNASDC